MRRASFDRHDSETLFRVAPAGDVSAIAPPARAHTNATIDEHQYSVPLEHTVIGEDS